VPLGIKWFTFGLVLNDLGEFLLAKFKLFLGIVVKASLINFGNQFTLFHFPSPNAIFTAA
jgi:hypothetical protein